MRSYLITAVAAGAAASLRVAEAAAWWEPPVNTTWQWQLQFQVNTSFQVDMYDVDLFGETTYRWGNAMPAELGAADGGSCREPAACALANCKAVDMILQ